MRFGELQQVGPPAELYGHPNNLFVAGFIGSPSMNFLAGEISGDSVHLPIGEVRIPDELRRRLESGPGGGRRGVIAGLRPEHFEDAALVADRSRGVTFKAKIDVLESMGSEFYAYFVVASDRVSSSELEEIAADAGSVDLPSVGDGTQVTARLGADSTAREGAEAELWFDSHHLQLFDAESGESLLAGNSTGNGAAQAPPASSSASTPS
jgi:multiple sugar transport system ATP-binding protein